MMICCDQLVSIINLRALIKFQIFISYSVGIITDYVNFHTFENVRMTSYLSEKLGFRVSKVSLYTKNQLWVPSSFFNQFLTYK